MMTKRYLIKLCPTDKFFFGGERTFGAGTSRNYLAKSEDFPQQTTLLGMLRYQLLAQNGQIPIKDKAKAAGLIGKESFRTGGKADFGQIMNLSPVFLMRDDVAYRPNAFDDKFYESTENKVHYEALTPTTTPGKAYMSGRVLDNIPMLKDFDHKKHYQERLLAEDGTTCKKSEVLCSVEQVGIQKGKNGQTLTNAFFKQTLLRFPSLHWTFAFYADLTTDLHDAFVTLGGEQSLFQMKVTAVQEESTGLPIDSFRERFGIQSVVNSRRIELLSDAYVATTLYDHCQLAYTETISFRSIKTDVDTTRHYHNEPNKTERLELLQRGSVLWSNDPEKTMVALRKAEFEKIGYNAFYNGPLPTHPLTSSPQ